MTKRETSAAFFLVVFTLLVSLTGQVFAAEAAVDLRAIASRANMDFSWTERGEKAALRGQGMAFEFTADSRIMRIAGLQVFLGDGVIAERGSLHVSRIDYETFLQPLLFPATLRTIRPIRTVAIDPGHGGRDPGTRSRELGLEEKTLTLAIARKLKSSLEREGFRVVLTRDDDRYVELDRRAAIANRAEADLFVSLHFNSAANPAVVGTETYLLTPSGQRSTGQSQAAVSDSRRNPANTYDGWNGVLGFMVQRQLVHDLRTHDRGLKRARFRVLRDLDCPAILIEAGYLSNLVEARRISGSYFQNQLVESVTLAIMHFRETVDRVNGAQ